MNYPKFERPLEYAERMMVQNILTHVFPIGERLPAERELATQLGVTRPTLREAIRHLEQEGWLLVQAGKPTLVRDFWREGGLNLLSRIVQYQGYVEADFITQLLDFRLLLAPHYTQMAVRQDPHGVLLILENRPEPDASAAVYAAFDWQLQRTLTRVSGNVIFPLILNGFADFYEKMGLIYFQPEVARQSSYTFYTGLEQAALTGAGETAYQLTYEVMQASITLWKTASVGLTRVPLVIEG